MASPAALDGTIGPKQAAELLGTSEKGVRAWIARGDSPFVRIEQGRRDLYRVAPAVLEQLRPELPRCRECREKGRDVIALGPSRACQDHVARTTQTGATRSPEAKKRMAAAKRGTTRPIETRAKIAATLRQQRERGGELVTCPDCGSTRYRSPSSLPVTRRCAGCYQATRESRASRERAQSARRALIEAGLEELRAQRKLTVADLSQSLLVSRPVITSHYIGRNLLSAELLPFPAGSPRLVVDEPELKRFLRRWAQSVKGDESNGVEPDPRRVAWLDPDVAVGRLRSLGLVSKLAVGPLTEADVEEALAKRVKARRRVLLPHSGGRPPAPAATPHHVAWSRALDEIEAELREEHERDLNLQLATRSPTRWDAARELGHRLDPTDPERAIRRVWRADKRVKALETTSNGNYPSR